MPTFALSTMFAQQDRFTDGAAFARFAAESGYDAIEISHSTPAEKIAGIAQSAILPVTSVHSPAPFVAMDSGDGNLGLNLAAPDEELRAAAVANAQRSIALAADLGARFLVVHLGQVGGRVFEEEMTLRKLFEAGVTSGPDWDAARSAAHETREALAPPYREAAAESLRELVEAARPHGIAIGLESRIRFHQFPHPAEFNSFAEPYSSEEVGYWHDTGHVEVMHRLGLVDRDAWHTGPFARCIGAHLTDVRGLDDHLAPGDGTADWTWIAAALGHLPAYTLEINQHQPDDRVRAALPFLSAQGLGQA